MVSKRDRIIAVTDYLFSLGIDISLCNNKARGNKGFFKVRNGKYAIQIAKNQTEDEILTVLVHEFAHFVHYKHDNTLKDLDFAFGDLNEDILNELMELTIKKVSKDFAYNLISDKNKLTEEIKKLSSELRNFYPDFKQSQPLKKIESRIKKTDARYLLKYDRVKVLKGFIFKIYSIDNLDTEFAELDMLCKTYIRLKFFQRKLKRISSKISRLNKYYNSPTEMFARFLEFYICNNAELKMLAPNSYKAFSLSLSEGKLQLLSEFQRIYGSC